MWSFRKEIHKINLVKPVPTIACSNLLEITGNQGVYIAEVELGTDIGIVAVNYEAFGIPDRFLLEWDSNIVADSKYVGDSLAANANALTTTNFTNVPEFEVINQVGVPTGNTYNFTVASNELADGSPSQPTAGAGTISFVKTTAFPTKMRIIVYAPLNQTAFNLTPGCPTTPSNIEVQVGRSDKVQTGCSEFFLNPNPYYILANQTFATATKLFTDVLGTTVAPPDWYSDGSISRYWDGTEFNTLNAGTCTTEPVVVGYDPSDSALACSNFTNTPRLAYIPIGETFSTATNLLISSGSVNPDFAGIYSDGTIWREFNGAGAFINSGNC